MTLTATATGGANDNYLFQAQLNGGAWTSVNADYNASATTSWQPAARGSYLLRVGAKDMDANPPQVIFSPPVAYTVYAPLTSVTFTAAPPSPQTTALKSVSLTAAALGGADVVYQFLVNNQVLQNFSATATCTWMPTASGTYTLTVNALDLDGATPPYVNNAVNPNALISSQLTYKITNPLSSVYLAASPVSPQVTTNTSPLNVTLTATPVGGAAPLYTFQESTDGINWTTINANSSTATAIWAPTTPGNYTVQVVVTDANGGANSNNAVKAQIPYVVTPPLSKVTLTPNLASPRTVQTPIILTALPDGGAQNYYTFYYNIGNGPVAIAPTGLSKSVTWTPTTAGTYSLTVTATDNSLVSPALFTSKTVAYVITSPLSAATLTGSPSSPVALDLPVTLTAGAIGGALPYFQFTVTPSGGATSTLQDYSTTSTCSWMPLANGTYTLGVNVQDKNSLTPLTTYSATMTYVATNGLASVSMAAAPSSPRPLGVPITLTASSVGGGKVYYQFTTTDSNGNNANTLQQYGPSNTCNWTPTVAGTYLVHVTAEDMDTANPASNQQPSTPISYIVTPALSAVALTTNIASPCAVGTPVTLQATPTGGANVRLPILCERDTGARLPRRREFRVDAAAGADVHIERGGERCERPHPDAILRADYLL